MVSRLLALWTIEVIAGMIVMISLLQAYPSSRIPKNLTDGLQCVTVVNQTVCTGLNEFMNDFMPLLKDEAKKLKKRKWSVPEFAPGFSPCSGMPLTLCTSFETTMTPTFLTNSNGQPRYIYQNREQGIVQEVRLVSCRTGPCSPQGVVPCQQSFRQYMLLSVDPIYPQRIAPDAFMLPDCCSCGAGYGSPFGGGGLPMEGPGYAGGGYPVYPPGGYGSGSMYPGGGYQGGGYQGGGYQNGGYQGGYQGGRYPGGQSLGYSGSTGQMYGFSGIPGQMYGYSGTQGQMFGGGGGYGQHGIGIDLASGGVPYPGNQRPYPFIELKADMRSDSHNKTTKEQSIDRN